jgi:hypothetical protein
VCRPQRARCAPVLGRSHLGGSRRVAPDRASIRFVRRERLAAGGPSPELRNTVAIVVAETLIPSFSSSPWIRTSASERSPAPAAQSGRASRPQAADGQGLRRRRRRPPPSNARCQRRSVCGLTAKRDHRSGGSSRLTAASKARSPVVDRGRFPPRLRIASWSRSTTISGSRSPPPRARRPTRQHTSRYSKHISRTRSLNRPGRDHQHGRPGRNRISLPHTLAKPSINEPAPRAECRSSISSAVATSSAACCASTDRCVAGRSSNPTLTRLGGEPIHLAELEAVWYSRARVKQRRYAKTVRAGKTDSRGARDIRARPGSSSAESRTEFSAPTRLPHPPDLQQDRMSAPHVAKLASCPANRRFSGRAPNLWHPTRRALTLLATAVALGHLSW